MENLENLLRTRTWKQLPVRMLGPWGTRQQFHPQLVHFGLTWPVINGGTSSAISCSSARQLFACYRCLQNTRTPTMRSSFVLFIVGAPASFGVYPVELAVKASEAMEKHRGNLRLLLWLLETESFKFWREEKRIYHRWENAPFARKSRDMHSS